MNNADLYNAVLSGIAGSNQNVRVGVTLGADYTRFADRAVILASAVDALIPTTTVTQADALLMTQVAAGLDFNRCLVGTTPLYSGIASDIVALWTEFRGRVSSGTGVTLSIEVDTIAQLRALVFSPQSVYVKRYDVAGSEMGGGWFHLVATDVTSGDNSGTIFVTAAGKRYYRDAVDGNGFYAHWFGVIYDATIAGGGTDCTDKFFQAVAIALGLSGRVEFETGRGDYAYGYDIGRNMKPLFLSGPLKLTRKMTDKWMGVDIRGNSGGTDSMQGHSATIFLHHAEHGIEGNTGTLAIPCSPSIALHDLNVIRTTPFQATGLDNLSIDGDSWFMGFRVANCCIQGGRNAFKVQSTYYSTGAKIISNIVLNDRSYFQGARERGIDIQFFCQLSEIRNISCWHNLVGAFRIWADSTVVESIDIEGGGSDNVLKMYGSHTGGFYAEITIPAENGVVNLDGCLNLRVDSMSSHITSVVNYKVTAGGNIEIVDRLPIRPIGCCNVKADKGYLPHQTYAAGTIGSGSAHTIGQSSYLEKINTLPPELIASSGLWLAEVAFTTQASFDGIDLPGFAVGTIGAPLSATGLPSSSGVYTAGKIYMIAWCIKYRHAPPVVSAKGLGGFIRLDEGGVMSEPYSLSYQNCRQLADDTIQVVGFFIPPATSAQARMYIYPYCAAYNANPDYDAIISVVYEAEVIPGAIIPQLHVPTLLRGAPFEGDVVLNGATPVAVGDIAIKKTSKITTTRTVAGGTMAPYTTTITPGVGFTVTGVAGDTSTLHFVRT